MKASKIQGSILGSHYIRRLEVYWWAMFCSLYLRGFGLRGFKVEVFGGLGVRGLGTFL